MEGMFHIFTISGGEGVSEGHLTPKLPLQTSTLSAHKLWLHD